MLSLFYYTNVLVFIQFLHSIRILLRIAHHDIHYFIFLINIYTFTLNGIINILQKSETPCIKSPFFVKDFWFYLCNNFLILMLKISFSKHSIYNPKLIKWFVQQFLGQVVQIISHHIITVRCPITKVFMVRPWTTIVQFCSAFWPIQIIR